MEIREMDYSQQYGERYIVTDFTRNIYDSIKNSILSYTKEDIEEAKKEIIENIIKDNKEIYMQKKSKDRYEPRISDLEDITENGLQEVIFNVKTRYINEEAIMQLVIEGKLIPIDNVRPMPPFVNGSDILVDVKHKGGNTCLYFYLDLLPISQFRVSRTIYN